MYKYILVFEDSTIKKVQEIDNDDLISADLGILDIIRLSDLKHYYDKEWHNIEVG